MNKRFFRFVVIGFLFAILTSCSSEDSSNKTEAKLPIITVYDYSPMELETMKLINNYRVSIGLNALEKINHVSYKSEEHDAYMIANNVVNHNDFVARSENIIKALGAVKVSENIAYNYNSAQAAFDAWMNSPGHRENIEGDFTNFGLSIRENPVNGRKYYTNIFVKI
ncbi:CAP domain-containing protein [Flavobacterium aquariorum]|uniref:CAP domain-containing protein n=1 Tax=Flavobacterium aquariorum TaxID=2217670 RepID=A0A2W7TP21_9FLAO|nr:CAP domain-containing protein [Flavobacterium aquariorum]PZX92041.1 CAP domain-containing protein [Flavobacterium aquariorum]